MKHSRRLRYLLPALLLLCVLLYAASYFAFGLSPAFLLGLIQSALSPSPKPGGITAPAGVRVAVFADQLTQPTALAFAPDEKLFVAQLGGEVLALADTNAGGTADSRQTYATLNTPLGLAFRGTDLYVSRRGGVTIVRDTDGDSAADEYADILTGLPASRHQTDSLVFGPDGLLYLGQGSTSDRGEAGRQPLEATILTANPDGSGLRVFASGTRNPYDLAFYPGTSLLFATDNGRDVPTSGVPDELNLIVDGGKYGWPDCWGAGKGKNCEGTIAPVVELPEHSSADGFAFYTGGMFPEWQNNAFICLFGPNSQDPDIGHVILRVELTQSAEGSWSGTVHDFASGFASPLDIVVGPDGALYVADFRAGIVYRLYR